VEEVLGAQLPKPQATRCGNWEVRPLAPEQQQYAALDAWAGLAVHWGLAGLPPRVTLSQQLMAEMQAAVAAAAAAAAAAATSDPVR
jgi:ribonuclease D